MSVRILLFLIEHRDEKIRKRHHARTIDGHLLEILFQINSHRANVQTGVALSVTHNYFGVASSALLRLRHDFLE